MIQAPRDAQSGFTLVEALAAIAIVGVIMGAIAAIAGQWLPHWRHGFLALQQADQIGQSLDRLAADLSSAEYARLDPGVGPPAFRGGEDVIIFARAATGPDAGPHLDYVRISAVATSRGMETQRARALFAPGPIGPFRDAVTVLRAPFRLTFAYQTPDGRWLATWGDAASLPRAIRISVKAGDTFVTSTAFPLKTTSGPDLASPPSQQRDEGPPGTNSP